MASPLCTGISENGVLTVMVTTAGMPLTQQGQPLTYSGCCAAAVEAPRKVRTCLVLHRNDILLKHPDERSV